MTITPPCPHCGRDLPAVTIDMTTEATGKRELTVTLTPHVGAAWRAAVRLAHPWCFGGKDDIDLPELLAA